MGPVKQEVEALHAALAEWIGGACDGDEAVFDERIGSRLGEDFTLVAPSGRRPSGRDVRDSLRDSYGSNPDFRIAIDDLRIIRASDTVVVVSFVEWQRNASQSTPPDNGRVVTAVLVPDTAAPNGLRWLHLQETMLPEEEMSARRYDF
ncbi:MAG: hypothetical protein PVI30_06165 [Myxococcales bacterium]|jgi:hypothetical protein